MSWASLRPDDSVGAGVLRALQSYLGSIGRGGRRQGGSDAANPHVMCPSTIPRKDGLGKDGHCAVDLSLVLCQQGFTKLLAQREY